MKTPSFISLKKDEVICECCGKKLNKHYYTLTIQQENMPEVKKYACCKKHLAEITDGLAEMLWLSHRGKQICINAKINI